MYDSTTNTTVNKLCGDVDFDEAKQVASYITPVPGGGALLSMQIYILAIN